MMWPPVTVDSNRNSLLQPGWGRDEEFTAILNPIKSEGSGVETIMDNH